jgi:hypothetical protein
LCSTVSSSNPAAFAVRRMDIETVQRCKFVAPLHILQSSSPYSSMKGQKRLPTPHGSSYSCGIEARQRHSDKRYVRQSQILLSECVTKLESRSEVFSRSEICGDEAQQRLHYKTFAKSLVKLSSVAPPEPFIKLRYLPYLVVVLFKATSELPTTHN